MQKMMTKAIEKQAPRLYETDGQGYEAVAIAHYFSCLSNWDWYLTEYEPETGLCFGLVKGFETELGYFSIREFEELNKNKGFEFIERDIHWKPCRLREVA